MGRATVVASIKELEAVELLARETRYKDNGSLNSNMYYPNSVLEGSSVPEPPKKGSSTTKPPVVPTENHGSSDAKPPVVPVENCNNNTSNSIIEHNINSDELMASSTGFVIVGQNHQASAPGVEIPADKPEKVQTPAKKVKSPKLSADAMSSIYGKFIDIYDVWFKDFAGVPPKIDGAGGNAAKTMIRYLRSVSRVKVGDAWKQPETPEEEEAAILSAWQFIFNNWNKLDPFYQNKTRLIDINSNFQNIISQIKNGHGKKQPVTNQTTASDVATSFAKIDDYFQTKDREANQVDG